MASLVVAIMPRPSMIAFICEMLVVHVQGKKEKKNFYKKTLSFELKQTAANTDMAR